ncbi:MAG: carboxypeptidase-like regulatory domain-containing protein, partial [Bacteroidota bacterium]
MRWRHICFFLLLFGFQWTFGQQVELRFQLIDEATQKPIADAHVFISDASIGSTSDAQGICAIKVAPQETQTLIISHLSYELLVIKSERFATLTDGAVVTMTANGINLNEIAFTAKRSAKWKKNFRTFKRALLGEGTPATKCKILNPEVLRFEDQDGKLVATAIDLL